MIKLRKGHQAKAKEKINLYKKEIKKIKKQEDWDWDSVDELEYKIREQEKRIRDAQTWGFS
jgi:hypothetical protein